MDVVYAMPNQPHRLFINVVHACPNACAFCVDFVGRSFFGFDLKGARAATVDAMVSAVSNYEFLGNVREIYFCGIGEPLLHYDRVIDAADRLRRRLPAGTVLAVNTSGTYYSKVKRVDFARNFDLVQVSLNAENKEKYDLICRPKMANAYDIVLEFMEDLKNYISKESVGCRVELSVVDTSALGKAADEYASAGSVPVPDFSACRRIAEEFGWPLKIKQPMHNWADASWEDFATGIRRSVVAAI